MIKEKNFAVDKSKPYILVTTLHILELFVKNILTFSYPRRIHETRLYFVEIHAKLIFEEADCEVLPWRSSVAVIFKGVQGYLRVEMLPVGAGHKPLSKAGWRQV